MESGGCRQCSINSQCSAASPICDAETNLCRSCVKDDECDSLVCDTALGNCVAESDVLYIMPDSSGTCSRAAPCRFADALQGAFVFSRVIRLLPGTYTSPLEVKSATNLPLRIVATGAVVTATGDMPALFATAGANLDIRNLTSTSQKHIQCGDSSIGISKIRLSNSLLTGVGTGGSIVIYRCSVEILDSTLTNTGAILQTDSSLKFDRVRKIGQTGSIQTINALRSKLDIYNSLVVDTQIQDQFSDQFDFTLAYSTCVSPTPLQVCNGQQSHAVQRVVRVENSIVYNSAGGEGLGFGDTGDYMRPDCMYASTIAYPQFHPVPMGIIVEDPQFTNAAGQDFHLTATSPGLNRATTASVPPTMDVERRQRDGTPDLGAYERP